ncbi:folate family ECF transporter S component [Pseudoramibacter faecis]|uniref:folate family ECF transporter S component n=1 Tax=Pseudoramibacter faecis TaxID=3108534 RepID=UPI002E788BED|nr:folate family ECF transporter S component [Pseudoramibacter sp. HA2172]
MAIFNKTKTLTLAALFVAISVIFSFFKVPITSLTELRFNILPIAAAGMLLGPIGGTVVGAAADILGYLVRPTGPFFPGFTISAALSGLIFGLMLHGHVSLKRTVLAQAINALFISFLLNSLWLSMLYGNGFVAVLTARAVKELVMFPINTALIAVVTRPVMRWGTANQQQVLQRSD